jgi:tetratricopeptide (TPR) repeat protein
MERFCDADSGKKTVCRSLLLCVLLLAPAGARCQVNSSPYNEPRLAAWSRLFLDGKRAETLAAVEADLRSPSPHPFAAYIWTTLQEAQGRLKEAWNEAEPALHDRVGPIAQARLASVEDGDLAVIAKPPPTRAAEVHDVWALDEYSTAAGNLTRYDDELAYNAAAARAMPSFFLIAHDLFLMAGNSESVRRRVAELVKPGSDLATTPLGRYLARLLPIRPVDSLEQLAAIDAFLKECPNDYRALRLRAEILSNHARHEEALDSYSKALAAFPFVENNWEDFARELARVGKKEELNKLVQQRAALFSKDDAAARPRMARLLVSAYFNAGEKGRARDTLDAALKQWPQDPELQDWYAALELEGNRAAAALPYARRAAELAPTNQEYTARLIEALRKSGKVDEAYGCAQAADARFLRRSVTLYSDESDLLDAMGRHEERIRLLDKAMVEYPGAAWMMRAKAEALYKGGKAEEALAALKSAFRVAVPSEWSIARIREFSAASGGRDRAARELEMVREQFPWVEDLWDDAASNLPDPKETDARLRLWRAAASSCGRYWPYDRITSLLVSNRRWQEAQANAAEALARRKDWPAGDRASAVLASAWIVGQRLSSEQAGVVLPSLPPRRCPPAEDRFTLPAAHDSLVHHRLLHTWFPPSPHVPWARSLAGNGTRPNGPESAGLVAPLACRTTSPFSSRF